MHKIGFLSLSLVSPDLIRNNYLTNVNDIFCDKDTFLPCIEPEVRIH